MNAVWEICNRFNFHYALDIEIINSTFYRTCYYTQICTLYHWLMFTLVSQHKTSKTEFPHNECSRCQYFCNFTWNFSIRNSWNGKMARSEPRNLISGLSVALRGSITICTDTLFPTTEIKYQIHRDRKISFICWLTKYFRESLCLVCSEA
jgi:hypothetical protein